MGSSTLKVIAAGAAAYYTGGQSLAWGAAGAGAMAYSEAETAKKEQEALMQQSADEQRKAQSVTAAGQAQQAAIEARQQVREERVRRARIMQAATNTGTQVSSGAYGAVGSLSTNLSANIGANRGAIMRGQETTGFMQNAADLNLQSQFAGFDAQNAQSLFALSTSIFTGNMTKGK